MITVIQRKAPPSTPLPDVRSTLTNRRTASIDRFVIDKTTGEVLGRYSHSKYKSEASEYTPLPPRKKAVFVIEEDGTPFFLSTFSDAEQKKSAEILLFPAPEAPCEPDVSSKSNAGRPATTTINPIAGLLQYFRFDGYPTAWLDDYTCGAAGVEVECEGSPIATIGRFNVAPSDVRRVLYLPEISTDTAALILCNHEMQPMSIRQVERVVKAAWIALGGLMLYLERHQELLRQFDYIVDFNEFWLHRARQNCGDSPKKAEVMTLLADGEKISVVAKLTGIHRNTVSRWKRESAATQ